MRKLHIVNESVSGRNTSTFLYLSSAVIVIGSLVYASVPLYRMFCQKTGFAGTPKIASASGKSLESDIASNSTPTSVFGAHPVRISFVAETGPAFPWRFVPEQRSLTVVPGETALAFYSAENTGSREIVGMATYNVIPAKAAQYFNKIQCFCFEEQRLGPQEKVDMPLFFYLDPEFAYDPMMDTVQEIVLGYQFFESKGE